MDKNLGVAVGLALVVGVAAGCDSKSAANSASTGALTILSGEKTTRSASQSQLDKTAGAEPGDPADAAKGTILNPGGEATPEPLAKDEEPQGAAPAPPAPQPTTNILGQPVSPQDNQTQTRRRRPGRVKTAATPAPLSSATGSKTVLGGK